MKANPFKSSYGQIPYSYLSREETKEEILSAFLNEYKAEHSYIITGIRGSGKTVLLTDLSKELGNKGWYRVDISPRENMIESLALQLEQSPNLKPLWTKLGLDISLFGVADVTVSSERRNMNYRNTIQTLLEYLKKANKKVIITIDEVTNTDNFFDFVQLFQIFVRNEEPVFLLLAGLYENIYGIQTEKMSSFFRRCPKVILKPLNERTIAKSYREYLQIPITEAIKLAEMTKGYAFGYQLLGRIYYDNKGSDKDYLEQYKEELAEYVYDQMWFDITKVEKKIIVALAKSDSNKVKDIREVTEMSSGFFGRYRDILIKKGFLIQTAYGYVDFALPFFKEYVLEQCEYEEG